MAEKTFEKSLSDLEKIVQLLQNGDLSLDESIQLYEKGMKLANECNENLEKSKLKIEELKAGNIDV